MKRLFTIFIALIFVISICACGGSDSPISTTRPLPNYDPNPTSTEAPEESAKPEEPPKATTPEPTNDVRNEPETIRQEIANLIRDAESLIDEGLYDDAKMVLRDLNSRDLTKTEQEKVDKLYARLIVISD